MKRTTYLFAATLQLFSVIVAVSCNNIEPLTAEKDCTIILSTAGDLVTDEETKAYESDTGATIEDEEWEAEIHSVQYLIYRLAGTVCSFYGKETVNSNHKKSHSCEKGNYKIYAIVNGPSLDSLTISDINSTEVYLNDITKASGIMMSGYNSVTVETGKEECPITVKRHLTRVNLVSIKNNTEDEIPITFKYAFLSNVVANNTVTGGSGITKWDNLAGRKNSDIVTPDNVDDAEMTLYSPDSPVILASGETRSFGEKLYGFSNSTLNDSFGASATSGKTRLVVVCEVEGVDYYYPVTFNSGFEDSATYDVKLSILGIGSTDPNILVNKVGMTFTVAPWTDGKTYDEEY